MRRRLLCRASIIFLALTCAQFALSNVSAASSGKIIYTFAGGADGSDPESDLVLDAKGNLYGTTFNGGVGLGYGCGTVFELIRTGTIWQHKVLYSFNGAPTDGCGPQAGLVFDSAGNLYGTTIGGGANTDCDDTFGSCGTVFKLTPNSQGGWSETVLYNFGSFSGDGNNPNTDLIFDSQGNLYGTTFEGGQGCRGLLSFGCGTVFQLTPQSDGTWTENIIYQFAGGPTDGTYPMTPVILDAQGNLFGATEYGGTAPCDQLRWYQGCGAVYQLMPNSTGGWTEKLLYSFHRYQGTAVYPSGGLVLAADGGILGTSSLGGNGEGAVFRLEQTSYGWEQTILYRFYGDGDGTNPIGRLALAPNGHLFGATSSGGSPPPLGYGTIFEVVPTENIWNRWKEIVLFNGSSADGSPAAGPVVDSQGHVYGAFGADIHSGKFGSIYEVIP
jgi:hypothetical protein